MKRKLGFTLIETVIAVVLVGFIVSFAFSSFNSTQKAILRGNKYSQLMYMALADNNRGVALYENTGDIVRETEIIQDGVLKVVRTTVTGNIETGDIPIEIVFIRYME